MEVPIGIANVPINGATESSPVLSTVDREAVLRAKNWAEQNVWKQHTKDWSHKLVYMIIDDSGSNVIIYVGRQEDKDSKTKDRLQQHIHGETSQTADNAELANWNRAVVIRAKDGGKEFSIEETKILEAILKYRLERYSKVEMKTKQVAKSFQGKSIEEVEKLGEYAELVIQFIDSEFNIGDRHNHWMRSNVVEDTAATFLNDQKDNNIILQKNPSGKPSADLLALIERKIIKVGDKLYARKSRIATAIVLSDGCIKVLEAKSKDGSDIPKELLSGLDRVSINFACSSIGKLRGQNGEYNAWEYWHYENDNGKLVKLRELKDKYLT